MAWAKPDYPRNEVNEAGRVLCKDTPAEDELEAALEIISNWRSCHAYPLNTFQMTLRRKVKAVQEDVLVAQRIKRLESIEAKLLRFDTMQLSQMQDIGGCRAVLRSLKNVERVADLYRKSRFDHVLKGEKNYIITPKDDGYRSLHLIYQYKGYRKTKKWDLLRVEIQLRSLLQHAWATAVEAVGLFTEQALKSNEGSADWRRFFAVMSSAIAEREKTPLVPNTPQTHAELCEEIRDLATRLHVEHTLSSYSAALNYIGTIAAKDAKYFLVRLSRADQKTYVTGFTPSQSQTAQDRYMELEKGAKDNKDQVVLVSVDSVAALRRAYPNYFLDTQRFSALLKELLSESKQSAA